MDYICTPEEAQPIANAVKKFLISHKYNVKVEKAINNSVEYRTTLLAQRNHYSILIEAQHRPDIEESIRNLALDIFRESLCAELFIATNRDANFSGKFLKELDKSGIGMIIVEENGTINIDRKPKNPALIVTPEPGLKYGKYATQVSSCLKKFNTPNSLFCVDNFRKDALRDLCEIVENMTEELSILLTNKGYITCDEDAIRNLSWSSQINLLASSKSYNTGYTPVINDSLKTDLHSFRDARNKIDHKVNSKREEIARQQQMPERMMMGPRLIDNLMSICNSIRRKRTFP